MKLLDRLFGPRMALSLTELKDRKYDYKQLDRYTKKFFKNNPKLVVEDNWIPTMSAFRRLNLGKGDNSESFACVFNYALDCIEKYIIAVYCYNWDNKLVGVAGCVFKAGDKYKMSVNGSLCNAEFDSIEDACSFIHPEWVKAFMYKENKQGYYTRKIISKVK